MSHLANFSDGVFFGLGFLTGILLGGWAMGWLLWRKVKRELAAFLKAYDEARSAKP